MKTKLTVEIDEKLRRRAKARAALEGTTLAHVVRESLEAYVAGLDALDAADTDEQAVDDAQRADAARLQRQLAALEALRQHRQAILADRRSKPLEIDVVELIRQVREEQDTHDSGALVHDRD